jgi:ATP-dependent helicase/nuclease subunit B
MRKAMGMPDADMRIGQSAHDFTQGFCAADVILTRSGKDEARQTVPARWLERLSTVMAAAGLTLESLGAMPYPAIAQALKSAPQILRPLQRPAPRPPRHMRPKKLPVTAVETWMHDPYALYAKYILNLRRLDDLEMEMDAAQRGSLLHAVLNDFIHRYPDHLPPDSEKILKTMLRKKLDEKLGAHPAAQQFWRLWEPRFDRIAQWFVEHEREWRKTAAPCKTEIAGAYTMTDPDFTLTAKADRIDRMKDGSIAIIDYKTGTVPSNTAVLNGDAPQLPLEGVIACKDGFPGLEGTQVSEMAFWAMTGGAVPGKVHRVNPEKGADVDDIIRSAEEGLRALVSAFDAEGAPYYSLPRADKTQRFQDYAHLARVQEWAALDDAEEEDAA